MPDKFQWSAQGKKTMDWIKVIDGKVQLDWEELGDVLGVPYDYTASDSTLEIELRHVDAIVSAHMPKSAYIRNVTVNLRALPHVVKAKAKGNEIMVEFDMPVEVN